MVFFEAVVETIHSLLSVSISEFKQNPGRVVEASQGQPVAVLNHNRPAFYTVSPEFMAKMADLYDERQLESLVASRLKSLDQAVEVSIDDL